MSEEKQEKAAAAKEEPHKEISYITTILAMDRTLLAWVRTALSLNAFGFTLAKFVHDLLSHGALHVRDATYPRDLGVTLMVLGTGGLLFGVIDYWRSVKRLQKVISMSPWSSSLVLSLLLVAICILLMINLLTGLNVN